MRVFKSVGVEKVKGIETTGKYMYRLSASVSLRVKGREKEGAMGRTDREGERKRDREGER